MEGNCAGLLCELRAKLLLFGKKCEVHFELEFLLEFGHEDLMQ
jgi:hypothetical protein